MSTTISGYVNGVVANLTNADVQAAYSGKTITPTATFEFPWNGDVLEFVIGVTQEVTPDLLAALTAISAPFSQP